MDKHIREMNADKTQNDFQSQWERRKQSWRQDAELHAPDDATILEMTQRAYSASAVPEENIMPVTIKRRGRWIPYAAAASLITGISVIGLTHQDKTGGRLQPPVAKEVNVEGQTLRFMCNNGCSAQDVLFAANDVINK